MWDLPQLEQHCAPPQTSSTQSARSSGWVRHTVVCRDRAQNPAHNRTLTTQPAAHATGVHSIAAACKQCRSSRMRSPCCRSSSWFHKSERRWLPLDALCASQILPGPKRLPFCRTIGARENKCGTYQKGRFEHVGLCGLQAFTCTSLSGVTQERGCSPINANDAINPVSKGSHMGPSMSRRTRMFVELRKVDAVGAPRRRGTVILGGRKRASSFAGTLTYRDACVRS